MNLLLWFFLVPLLLATILALLYLVPLPPAWTSWRQPVSMVVMVVGGLVYVGGLGMLALRAYRAPMEQFAETLLQAGWTRTPSGLPVQIYQRRLPQQVQQLRLAFDHRNSSIRIDLEVLAIEPAFQVASAAHLDHGAYLSALRRLQDATHGTDAELSSSEGRARWQGRVDRIDGDSWRALSADFDRIAGVSP